MTRLIANISGDHWRVRDAYAECTVTFLPGEVEGLGLHPTGRISFDEVYGMRKHHCGRQMKKNMGMVVHTVDGDGSHLLVAADAGDVGPELRLNFLRNEFAAVLGSENQVNVDFHE